MCGIVGALSNTGTGSKARLDFFDEALYTDALRGWDSTGVFTVNRQKKVDVFKKAMTAIDFQNMNPYQTLMNSHHSFQYMVGHNRKATKGGVNHHNAHPFAYGDIVMVHNGTLNNHKSLPEGERFIVDSAALAHSISAIGAKATFEKAEGAFACVWYDRSNDSINMIRNEERPLSFAMVDDGVLLASEKLMLMWLADRNEINVKGVYDLPVGELYTFFPNKLHAPSSEKVDIKDPFYAKWYGGNSAGKKPHGKTTNVVTGGTTSGQTDKALPSPESANEKAKKKRELIQEERFVHHGLKQDEHIIVDSVGFVPYDEDDVAIDPIGRIDGLWDSGETSVLEVNMHGMHKSEYIEDAAYVGRAMCLSCDDNPNKDVIILADVEPCKVPEEDDDEIVSEIIDVNGNMFTDEELAEADDVYLDAEDETSWEDPKDEPRFRGANGQLISENDFSVHTDGGCRYCGSNLHLRDINLVGWIDGAHGGGCACPDCYETWKDMGVFLDYAKYMH